MNVSPDFLTTVKPVYNDHPWDRQKVVVVRRWSLLRGSVCQKYIFLIQKCGRGMETTETEALL